MCTLNELSEKVDSIGINVDKINGKLNGFDDSLDLFKSNMRLINETVSELKIFKSATVVKKMEEDIAVLSMMKDMQADIRQTGLDMSSLKQDMIIRPCYVNPEMYSKFMKELSNEIIDTKGRVFLVLDRKGKVKTINHYGCQLIGYPATKIIGKFWIEEFIPKEEKSRVSHVLKSLLDGSMNGYDTIINSIITTAGSVKIRWKNYIFTDEESTAILIISLGEKL